MRAVRHHAHADHSRRAVEQDDGPALAVPIRHPRRGKHPRRGQDVWRETQYLRHGDRVAHLGAQDDGQEVPVRVGDDVVEEVEPCEFPDLPVAQVDEDEGGGEGVDDGVAAVALDAGEDEAGFVGREEGAAGYEGGQGGFVREVDYEDVAEEAEEDGDGAFLWARSASDGKEGGRGGYDGEDPLPAVQPPDAFHLAQSPG